MGSVSLGSCMSHSPPVLGLTVMALFVTVSVLLYVVFHCVYAFAASCVLINK